MTSSASLPPIVQQPTPKLTPKFCLSPISLSTFFSRARSAVDDPISQHLSALSTPSRQPSISASGQRLPSTTRLSTANCSAFISDTLVPSWNERDRVLKYCEGVAASLENGNMDLLPPSSEQVEPDERLDPYSARVQHQKPKSDVEILQRALSVEKGIEDVVRSRTWGVVSDRCIGVEGDWKDSMREITRGSKNVTP